MANRNESAGDGAASCSAARTGKVTSLSERGTDVPAFTSQHIDRLRDRLAELRSLASVSAVLTDMATRRELRDEDGMYAMEPIDNALPLIGCLMMRLANEGVESADALWESHQQLREHLNQRGGAPKGAAHE